MVKWFKPLEDEFESVIAWLLYFDRHWYINSGAITDISVHEPDIHVLSKMCRTSLTSVGILSTLCSVPSLSSSCQTNDERGAVSLWNSNKHDIPLELSI